MPGSWIEDDIDTMMKTDEFATTVSYTAAGEDAVSIDVIFSKEEIEIDPYTEEQRLIPPLVWGDAADFTAIRQKDVFVINSVSYQVQKYWDNHGIMEITLQKT